MTAATLSHREIEILRPLATAAAELARDLYERRTLLVAQIEGLAREEFKVLTPLETKAAESLARLESAEKLYRECLAEAEAWVAKRERARFDLGHRRDVLTNELRNSAPGEIAALEADLRQAEREARDSFVYHERGTGQLVIRDGKSVFLKTVASNGEEVDAKVSACRAVLAECEQLRQQAIEPGELAQRLAEIRRRAGLAA